MDVAPGVGSAICSAARVDTTFDVAIEGMYLLFELQVSPLKLTVALWKPKGKGSYRVPG